MTAIPHPTRRPARKALFAAGAALAIVVGALTPGAAANAATPPTVAVAGATNISGESVTLTITDVTRP
ncbi:MAG: hypothetical protein ACTJHU_04015, partial [Mycetocola sp.]